MKNDRKNREGARAAEPEMKPQRGDEGMFLEFTQALAAMEADAGIPVQALKVDGGAASNSLLMQMQADYSALTVRRPAVRESTALGAAYLAGLSTGFWTLEDLDKTAEIDRTFTPAISDEQRHCALSGWRRALRAVKAWSEAEDAE